MFFFRFAYPWVLLAGAAALATVLGAKKFLRRDLTYRYPLTGLIRRLRVVGTSYKPLALYVIRAVVIALCVLLAARPQWVDRRSQVTVDGISIVLALDISGSMEIFDDLSDRRSRIDVAKSEAINFLEKRVNDPIGIVVFGAETLSLVPPTLDKALLKESVSKLKVGYVNPNGTALEQGLASAVARLRNSTSKSNVIILLTDGKPTGASAISMEQAIDLARQYKIKVYTMGIGSEHGGYIEYFGRVREAGGRDSAIDQALLERIARETGGRFFHAKNPREVREVYDTIDQLEKTKQTSNVFSRYHEALWFFLWPLLFLVALEVLLKSWLGRGIAW